jgi:uncharacterized protein (TIGR03435 family)
MSRHAIRIGASAALLIFVTGVAGSLVAAPHAQSQSAASTPSFEVASVRLHPPEGNPPRLRVNAPPGTGRLTLTALTVREVILSAYGIQPPLLADHDSPILAQRVDIVAKADAAATMPQLQRMLQPLLAERFGLVVRRETREMDAYLLVVARAGRLGPNLKSSTDCGDDVGTTVTFAMAVARDPDKPTCGVMPGGLGRIVAKGLDMNGLAALVSPSQSRPVIDRTGLSGRYDFTVIYTPEAFTAAGLARRGATAPPGVDPDGPPIFTALQEQLGLRLQSQRAPVEVLVIDAIKPLTEN